MRNPGQRSKSRAWANRERGSAMQDRANGLIDGDRYQSPRYSLQEIQDLFESTRLGASLVGELYGEPLLPGDTERLRDSRMVGIVERDAPLADTVAIGTPWSCTRADFSSGQWCFVLADRNGIERKVAFK